MHHDALQDGTLDQCQRLSIAPMIWSALAGGRLFSEHSPRAQPVRVALAAIAAELGVSEAASLRLDTAAPCQAANSDRFAPHRRDARSGRRHHFALPRTQWFAIWSAATGNKVP